MKTVVLILSLTVIVFSCNTEPRVVHLRTVKGKKEIAPKIDVNTILTIEIGGMTCEMGCGSSIRKELKATGGVERVKYDFLEGRKVQTATISFDKNKVSKDQMIGIITHMNDKQFTVGKTAEEPFNKTESDLPSKSSSKVETEEEETSLSLNEEHIGLPNLFEILAGVV